MEHKNIFDPKIEDVIKANLFEIVFAYEKSRVVVPRYGVKRIYFAGGTLCMDFEDDVLTINHYSETFGFFSGGLRRLLDIPSLRLLEFVLNAYEINHDQKWIRVTKRVVNS